MAGVVRSFTSFTAAATELVEARIYSGIHFRFADEDACLPLNGNKSGQLEK